jgi:hypothetical protein
LRSGKKRRKSPAEGFCELGKSSMPDFPLPWLIAVISKKTDMGWLNSQLLP